MGMNKFISLLILLLFALNGSVALSEDSSASDISQSYISDSASKSFKTGSIDRSHFSIRDLDIEKGNRSEVSGRKAASSANKFKLFEDSPYNIFTLYPDEPGSSQLLKDNSEPVEENLDFNSRFGSRNSTTKVFFGTLPFVSVPISNDNEEGQDPDFISKDSIFVFWYFKKYF